MSLDHEAVQRYFLHEIQMGEALISQGDITNGVEHLANAVIVCGEFFKIFRLFLFCFISKIFRTTDTTPSSTSANTASRSLRVVNHSNARVSVRSRRWRSTTSSRNVAACGS